MRGSVPLRGGAGRAEAWLPAPALSTEDSVPANSREGRRGALCRRFPFHEAAETSARFRQLLSRRRVNSTRLGRRQLQELRPEPAPGSVLASAFASEAQTQVF